jgi:hypothetical protein
VIDEKKDRRAHFHMDTYDSIGRMMRRHHMRLEYLTILNSRAVTELKHQARMDADARRQLMVRGRGRYQFAIDSVDASGSSSVGVDVNSHSQNSHSTGMNSSGQPINSIGLNTIMRMTPRKHKGPLAAALQEACDTPMYSTDRGGMEDGFDLHFSHSKNFSPSKTTIDLRDIPFTSDLTPYGASSIDGEFDYYANDPVAMKLRDAIKEGFESRMDKYMSNIGWYGEYDAKMKGSKFPKYREVHDIALGGESHMSAWGARNAGGPFAAGGSHGRPGPGGSQRPAGIGRPGPVARNSAKQMGKGTGP